MKGFLRRDGRKGIRNVVAVAYLVECAHHVSRLIVQKSGADDVHLIGFPGCYPNKYSLEMMQRLCTHPNVGAVLLVSLGCEGFNREQLRRTIAASGRPVDLLVIQQSGGTTRTLNAGLEAVRKMRAELAKLQAQYLIEMEDAVVVTRDAKGKVQLHQAMNLTAAGAASGGFWGMLIGMLFLNPLVGAAVGAGSGAAMCPW